MRVFKILELNLPLPPSEFTVSRYRKDFKEARGYKSVLR